MHLRNGLHLGYCTNIHRGETWEETFAGLRAYTLRVRDRVCSGGEPYGIGLRLSARAAEELSDPDALIAFLAWLEAENAYVFTINGFPYGTFHGTRVKEQVYSPDWTSPERVAYTIRLFDLLDAFVPPGGEGSVSTLPGSFKEFVTDERTQGNAIIENLGTVCAHVAALAEKVGKDLHLGVEPEPLGWFETSAETVQFFDRFRQRWGDRFDAILGVNYDTCHLAVEFENARDAIGALREAGIRLSKLHLSSALRLRPDPPALRRLSAFSDDVYLHQVVAGEAGAVVARFRDLPEALEAARGGGPAGDEWRVHFHIPVHAHPELGFGDTNAHILEVLDLLAADPDLCHHLEMETYTWEVLPPEMRARDVVDQLAREYGWTLAELGNRGLAR